MTVRGWAALLLIGVLGWSGSASAAHRLNECETAGRDVISIGLERRTGTLGDIAAKTGTDTTGTTDLAACIALAFGSDYQLLDWLENGKLDAAIVSPFAAALVQAAARSGRDYFAFASEWPLGGSAFTPTRLQVTVTGAGDEPARAAYDRFILTLGRADADVSARIHLDSHLSASLPLLVEYTESRLAVLADASDIVADAFWRRFLDGLSFTERQAPDAPVPDFVIGTRQTDRPCFGVADDLLVIPGCDAAAAGVSDVLVFSPKAGRVLFPDRRPAVPPAFGDGAVRQWLDGRLDTGTRPDLEALRAFLDTNFSQHEIGFRKRRHFRFTVPELWDQFARVDSSMRDAPFALVLTGGGVKAAYQTKMIDHLYGKGYLTNHRPPATDHGIAVDYVVGTSGGALLGIFVSAIDDPGDLNLTGSLWRNEAKDRYTASFDVFPVIEMPRYLSVLASVLVFALVLFIARRIKWLRSRTMDQTIPAEYRAVEELDTALSPRLSWALLVFLMPLVLKGVTGEPGLEHVPAIAGIFFSVCVLIALYSDNRLIFDAGYRWGDLALSGKQLFVLLAGAFLTVVPLINEEMGAFENPLLPLLGSYIGVGTLICCMGFVLVFFAVHRIFRTNAPMHVRHGLIPKGFVTIMATPIVAYGALFATGRPMFELNGEFWASLLGYSMLIAAALIGLSRLGDDPNRNPLTVGMDFVASDFPGRTYFITMKRYIRVTLFVTLAFLWWNLVMAPGIYGNEKAKEHFVEIYKKPVCAERDLDARACKQLGLDGPLFVPPKVQFVVSATSLEAQREWYFLLHPQMLAEGCPDITTVESGELLNELEGSDPRWQIADCSLRNQNLVDIAFASGSPFPVFPATRVELPEEGAEESAVWLVDGGYAHNVPIEAARAVAAGRVLVLSSSPLHREEEEDEARLEDQWLGNLSHNLTRLFPYLFERSQIEDKVSAENMFVATISPSLRWQDWPTLTDFRHVVVDKLVRRAIEDTGNRVGMIESWGPPQCRLGQSVFDCSVIRDMRLVGTEE